MFNNKLEKYKYVERFVFEGDRDKIIHYIKTVDKRTQKHKRTLDKLLGYLDLEPCERCVGEGVVTNISGKSVDCSKCDGDGFHVKEDQ